MSRVKDKDLLLVGSMPFDTAEQTFRWACDGGLASALPCLPDGEIGERSYWIIMLGYRLYHGHPQIETLRRPNPVDGVENWKPSGRQDNWSFKVREGVSAVRFGDQGWRLGYARDAINSYFVFRALREKGIVPNGIRFQICLPLTYSAFGSMFPERQDWPLIVPGLEAAMQAELASILAHIPAADLAIQWDCAVEVALTEQAFGWTTDTPMPELVARTVAALAPRIPADVMLGYHLCFGTLGGWPMHRPKDLGSCVDTAERPCSLGRPVDYIHMPVLDGADDLTSRRSRASKPGHEDLSRRHSPHGRRGGVHAAGVGGGRYLAISVSAPHAASDGSRNRSPAFSTTISGHSPLRDHTARPKMEA
jgi:hypothetical protein